MASRSSFMRADRRRGRGDGVALLLELATHNRVRFRRSSRNWRSDRGPGRRHLIVELKATVQSPAAALSADLVSRFPPGFQGGGRRGNPQGHLGSPEANPDSEQRAQRGRDMEQADSRKTRLETAGQPVTSNSLRILERSRLTPRSFFASGRNVSRTSSWFSRRRLCPDWAVHSDLTARERFQGSGTPATVLVMPGVCQPPLHFQAQKSVKAQNSQRCPG